MQISVPQVAVLASILCHALGIALIDKANLPTKAQPKIVVKLKIAEVKQLETKPEPKNIPKKKPKKKIAEKKLIAGLSKQNLTASTSSVKAPIGNTLLVEDKGLRLSDVEKMDIDRREDARLIASQTPSYTPQAEDAELQGRYEVDVYIDEAGKVVQAELAYKVGFGMDAKIIASAMAATYEPRKNRYGKPIAGWSKLVFVLKLN